MGDYEADERVRVTADELFAYLSDVANLPKYFPRMTSAEAVEGEEAVHVTARTPQGEEVEGQAWFKVDRENRTLSWGSEGRNHYHGHLTVTGVGENSAVAVTVSTERAEGHEIQQGVDEAVETIKKLLEEAHPRPEFDASWSGPMNEDGL
jgi:uncharacterized membrane protein